MPNSTRDFTIEAARGAPAVAGAVAGTMTMNEWVMIGTAIYIIIQSAYLIRKWIEEEADRKYTRARRLTEDARNDAAWMREESKHPDPKRRA